MIVFKKHNPAIENGLGRRKGLRRSDEESRRRLLKLANHVFSAVAKTESNFVFSPISIHLMLSLIAAGSKSRTLDELLAFLKSNSAEDLHALYSEVLFPAFADGRPLGGPQISVANGAWVDQTLPLKASFKHVAQTLYKADYQSVDFHNKAIEVVNNVNLWVEEETRGLIKHILPADAANSETKFILANALYFKGEWYEKFDASKTKDGEFHLLNGTSVQVPFMCSKKKQCVKAFDGFKVLSLSYKQGDDDDDDDDDYVYDRRRFCMYIFLPDARDGLPSLMHKLSSESGLLEECLPNYAVKVGEFRIPKFKVSFGFEVSDVLKELGVVSPFAGGEGLTEMVEGSEVYVSQIIHKSFVEVNEGGTEAGAATVTYGIGACWRPEEEEEVDFVADHPFLYFIREDISGTILLLGTVTNPL
ncbi:unnamed protein product [Cuscuta campestris]|uniref:Serpin domain-containing protein n=1 Tax=Cuscuta campestris TaxID=132261 RepID=A0A484NDJ3_9ASTE|nr:unnamed protein product [Cuscuta campestris]